MDFRSLASSSSGNAYIVSDGQTRILVECGISHRKLVKLTKDAGVQLSGISGVLISHEHKDHAKCALDLVKDGLRLYMSQGTAEALDVAELVEIVEHGQQFAVGTMDVVPFTTYHDAREPLGFLIQSRVDGESLVFATDTVNLGYQFPGVTILAVEANFDAYVLHGLGRMPESVRHRIENTHMEIDRLCDYLRTLDLGWCREVWLLHLSDSSSREAEFVYKVRRVVPATVRVEACGKEAN